MSDFSFNLPGCTPEAMKELVCPTCAHKFIWIQTRLAGMMIGMDQPKCPRCGGKECYDAHQTRFE